MSENCEFGEVTGSEGQSSQNSHSELAAYKGLLRTQDQALKFYERRCKELTKLVRSQADLIDWLKDKNEGFYMSQAWLELRLKVLDHYGAICMRCEATSGDGVTIQVDHIYPLSLYPHLALVFDNLQVLCEKCNRGKSNKVMNDYRPKRGKPKNDNNDVP